MYKELYRYYDTYGTYNSGKIYSDNRHFIRFNLEEDSLYDILAEIKPSVIISALRGNFDEQVEAHKELVHYAAITNARVIYLSSANVFDAFSHYPSYEFDKTLSESVYGKLKIRCETTIMRSLPERQWAIARVPMIFGVSSPRLSEIKTALLLNEPIEVFPHLIMNTTTDQKLSQQVHYMINRNKSGIYHLGSSDLIHHKEFVLELIKMLGLPQKPILKNVYTSNFDRYLAVLPRDNKLPQHLAITNEEVIEGSRKL